MGGRESEHNWGVKLPKNQYKVKLKKKKTQVKTFKGTQQCEAGTSIDRFVP